MKRDELIVGQPVWWIRRYAGQDAALKNAAIVTMLPIRLNGLCGLALRRPHGPYGDEWYPMWASARMLSWRAPLTETIPAFFAAAAAFAQRCLEVRYDNLMRLVDAGATSGSIGSDDPVDNELLDLDIAVGEMGLIFVRQRDNGYALQPMADCEFDAFVAVRASAAQEARG